MHHPTFLHPFRPSAALQALAISALLFTGSASAYAQPDEPGRVNAADYAPAANSAPVLLSPIPDQTHAENQAVNLDLRPHFSDADGDSLSFSSTSALPSGLTLAGGRISGTIGYSAANGSTYNIRILVNDGNGGGVIDGFGWTITDVNRSPTVTAMPDQSNSEGDSVDIDLNTYFSDPDGDTLTYSLSHGSLPSGLSLSSEGRITGSIDFTPNADSIGTVRFLADDGNGADIEETIIWTVLDANAPPELVGPIPDLTNAEGDTIDLDLSVYFADIDGDTLLYTFTMLPSNRISGLTFSSDGRVTGTIDYTAGGGSAYIISFNARDEHDGVVGASFDWTVTNTNRPPTISSDAPGDITLAEGESLDLALNDVFVDADGDTLTFTLAGSLPAGLSLSGDRIAGTVSYDASVDSPYLVTLAADDGNGGNVSTSFRIEVTNTNRAPIFDSGWPNWSVDEGQNLDDFAVLDMANYVSDPDGDTLTFVLTGGALPPGVTLLDGRLSGTVGYDAAEGGASGVYLYTVEIFDGNGGILLESASMRVTHTNQPPDVISALADQINAEGDTVDLDLDLGSRFADGDGDSLTLSLSGILPAGLVLSGDDRISGTIDAGAADGSPYVMTATADDGNGGTVSTSFFWYVTGDSNRAPVLLGNVPDQTNVAGDAVDFDLASYIADPDGDALTLSIDGALPGGLALTADGYVTGTLDATAAAASPYALTVTADDGRGGSVSDSFLWVVHPQEMIFVGGFEATE